MKPNFCIIYRPIFIIIFYSILEKNFAILGPGAQRIKKGKRKVLTKLCENVMQGVIEKGQAQKGTEHDKLMSLVSVPK